MIYSLSSHKQPNQKIEPWCSEDVSIDWILLLNLNNGFLLMVNSLKQGWFQVCTQPMSDSVTL